MKRRSKKAQQAYDTYREERNNFISEMRWCAACGATHDLSVHEILGGPLRMISFGKRELWLCLCFRCNADEFTDRIKWPVPKQLALKFVVDPAFFDLRVANKVKAPDGGWPYTGEEVLDYLKQLVTAKGPWQL